MRRLLRFALLAFLGIGSTTTALATDWPIGTSVLVASEVTNTLTPATIQPDLGGRMLVTLGFGRATSTEIYSVSSDLGVLDHWDFGLLSWDGDPSFMPDGLGGWSMLLPTDSTSTNGGLVLWKSDAASQLTQRWLPSTPNYENYAPSRCDDGSGGRYLAWTGESTTKPSGYFLLHTATDSSAAVGWPAAGRRIGGVPLPLPPVAAALATDSTGGVVVGMLGDAPYVIRYTSAGAVASGWSLVQLDYSGPPRLDVPFQLFPSGTGFMIGSWGTTVGSVVDLQLVRFALDNVSDPGWADSPLTVASIPVSRWNASVRQTYRTFSDDAGGAWVTWVDAGTFDAVHVREDGTFAAGTATTPAQPIGPGVGVAQLACPSHDGGLAVAYDDSSGSNLRVRWLLADGSVDPLDGGTGELAVNGSATLQAGYGPGDGTLYLEYLTSTGTYPDNTTFNYLTRVGPPGATTAVGPSPRDPAGPRLSLAGLRPNPATTTPLSVAFSLPGSAPATLELVDVAGRRLASREVGELGAGDHVVTFAPGTRVPPGLYFVRLTQAGRSLTARGAVVR